MSTSVRTPLTRLNDIEVFALDASSIQLSVRGAAHSIQVEIGSDPVEVDPVDGAAVVEVGGLDADTDYEVVVTVDGVHHRLAARTRADIGPITTRIATISDVHLGLEDFGIVRKIRHDGPTPHALAGAIAAVREAEAWGAELLVIKGDLCEKGTEADWDLARRLVDSVSIPTLAIPGNHEVLGKQELSPAEGFSRAGLGYERVQVRDLAGVRLILGDTAVDGRGSGKVDAIAPGVISEVDTSDRPILLAIHHNIERLPVPWFWPPGISKRNAHPFLDRLAELDRPIFMTSGHTHRNRRHYLGPDRSLLFTEVSSTSDYPGVWAGYEVSASAIRQTVRRIGDPEVVRWIERTRRAVGGIWPRWSQGRFDDRCIDLPLG